MGARTASIDGCVCLWRYSRRILSTVAEAGVGAGVARTCRAVSSGDAGAVPVCAAFGVDVGEPEASPAPGELGANRRRVASAMGNRANGTVHEYLKAGCTERVLEAERV